MPLMITTDNFQGENNENIYSDSRIQQKRFSATKIYTLFFKMRSLIEGDGYIMYTW